MPYRWKCAWAIVLGMSSIAWGQGGRAGRAAAQQQTGAPANPASGAANKAALPAGVNCSRNSAWL